MRPSRGFSVLTAIFLLMVLAVLAVIIASVTGLQQSSSQLDMLGARAYHAARTGLEYGVERVIDPRNTLGHNPVSCAPPQMPPCFAAQNLSGLGGSLAGFTVTVSCNLTANDVKEGNRSVSVYALTASACNEPDGGGACPNPAPTNNQYVSRQVEAIVSKCKDPNAAAPRCTCG